MVYVFSLIFFHLEILANVYSEDKGRENHNLEGMPIPESSIIVALNL
jgi:hypothetical protein